MQGNGVCRGSDLKLRWNGRTILHHAAIWAFFPLCRLFGPRPGWARDPCGETFDPKWDLRRSWTSEDLAIGRDRSIHLSFLLFLSSENFLTLFFFSRKKKKNLILSPTGNSRQHFVCFTDHVHFNSFKRTDRPTFLLSTHTVLHNSSKKSNPKLLNLEIFPEFFKIFAKMNPNETKK